MDNPPRLEPGVTLIERGSRRIYLIGTAHVSQSSADLVARTIRTVRPSCVAVELCAARAHALRNPDRWRETNIFSVLREGKAYVLLVQLLLASFQKRIAKQLNVRPGEEMLTAMKEADELGARLETIDRDVKITLRRAWGKARFWSTMQVVAAIITSFFSKEEISERQIEELKGGDALAEIIAEFSEYLPDVKQVLIDERDRYMAGKLAAASEQDIVAVVGAGHVPGIKAALGAPVDLAGLESIPPRSRVARIAGWTIFAAILGFFLYGFMTGGPQSTKMVGAWILSTGGFAALGAAAALAHPLTVLCAFFAAPITCLHPALAVGWFCALCEAFIRKPRVIDLEQLTEDTASISGFWSNRVSKVLLVLILANIGGAIGMLAGGFFAFFALQ